MGLPGRPIGEMLGLMLGQLADDRGFPDQLDREDFTALGIDAEMQLTPGLAALRAFQPAIPRRQRASGRCCPRANAAGRYQTGGAVACPASCCCGSVLNGPAR
jgi:hypothetical protein